MKENEEQQQEKTRKKDYMILHVSIYVGRQDDGVCVSMNVFDLSTPLLLF